MAFGRVVIGIIPIFFATDTTYTVMYGYDTTTMGTSPTIHLPLQKLFDTVFPDKRQIAHQ